jgi:protoheme IX farnesyltransferase
LETIKRYYSLTKPGVLYGNAITGVAGFLLAAGVAKKFDLGLFLATIIGMTLVIASACVMNNFLDRDIDSKMERTKKRATVQGTVSGRGAVLFSIVLGVLGFSILAVWTNRLVVAVGAGGFIDYVVLYGMLSKRLSIHGTLVGSISGAAPVLAGYVAVSGGFDAGAIIAFAILFLWQLPEFYSISIFRHDEYKAAGVPVMSVVKGVKSTKLQIYVYTAAFVTATLLLTAFEYTGYIYLAIMGLLGAYWLWLGAKGFEAKTKPADEKWARKMFRFSLVMVLAASVMMSVGPLLP